MSSSLLCMIQLCLHYCYCLEDSQGVNLLHRQHYPTNALIGLHTAVVTRTMFGEILSGTLVFYAISVATFLLYITL